MATAPETIEAVSKIAGIPRSIPETVVRRLGEAELVLRGSKGRASPPIRRIDIARILIGVLCISDGIEGSSAHIAKTIKNIGSGTSRSRLKAGRREHLDSTEFVDPSSSFIEEVSHLIEACADSDNRSFLRQTVDAIGLTFGGGKILGWLEVTEEGASLLEDNFELTKELGGGQRIIFGRHDGVQLPAMRREVRFDITGLIELADKTLGTPVRAVSGG
jgi:hypothetical protein